MDPRQITSFVSHISFCMCEKVPETVALGACFRYPFHQSPTHRLAAFAFLKDDTAERGEGLQRRLLLTFLDIHTLSPSYPPPVSQSDVFWLCELSPEPASLY